MRNVILTLISFLAISAAIHATVPLEGAWYGTNYTAPFAHAYRVLGELDVDRKEAIDRDVYHMSRLGLNAFRLHLWDVELTDSAGNLLENDHLDLLDYLIASLEKRGIDIVLTAQTNFGNGYPERDTDPNGAYTYRYPKCGIHESAEAQKAQARYLDRLVRHVNPYTGKSFASDPSIVGLEINNEPCHTGDAAAVEKYIRKMMGSLRKAGWKKPIFYNVSHNPDVTEAYFKAPIDGATYQWYPLGLVAGHTRRGNFLPYVDSYDIPFDTLPGFDRPAKVIYEFDPADNLAGYLFPAIARTFRKKGFRWITQFAYDPIDMARFNTEYQTHYLNLAYTPSKALAMMIAGEVVRSVPEGTDFGKYPVDTVFGPFTVSAKRDLAMMRTPDTYLYSNTTADGPIEPDSLKRVAGVGSSPVAGYDGSGAYFLDKLDDHTWRLELMPDVTIVSDPFAKPSLRKEVAVIDTAVHLMTLRLPGLGDSYEAYPVTRGNCGAIRADKGAFIASPGVYLLSSVSGAADRYKPDMPYADGHRSIGEYVMPPLTRPEPTIVHEPAALAYAGDSIKIDVTTVGPAAKVTVYPGDVSFWRKDNELYPLVDNGYGRWSGAIPTYPDADEIEYYIVVTAPDGSSVTYPEGYAATPLDWDYAPTGDKRYRVDLTAPGRPLALITPRRDMDGSQLSTLPGVWEGVSYHFESGEPLTRNSLTVKADATSGVDRLAVGKYIGPEMKALVGDDLDAAAVCLSVGEGVAGTDSVEISVVNADGFTYAATLPVAESGGIVSAPLRDMELVPTLLNPEPFPVFLNREFVPDPATATDLRLTEIDEIRLVVRKNKDEELRLPIVGVWLDNAYRK